MKVWASLICHSQEPYLKSVMENLYGLVDRMVVAEGSVREFWGEPWTDYTREVIREVDKGRKVMYGFLGNVKSKESLTEHNLRVVLENGDEGDWLIAMGADEAWRPSAVEYLRSLPEDVVWVGIPMDEFVGDFRHLRKKRYPDILPEGQQAFYDKNGMWMVNGKYHERAFRIKRGLSYFDNHTAIRDNEGRYVYADPYYGGKRLLVSLSNPEIRWVHYGWVGCSEWLSRKAGYYAMRSGAADIKGSVKKDSRYAYAMSGNPEVFDEKVYEIIDVGSGYCHPYPFEKHPYAKMTREEIFKSKPLGDLRSLP